MMKSFFVIVFALATSFAYADLLPIYIYDPALHRIGYEIFVYVAGAAMGGALVRYLAKRNWRKGEEHWRCYLNIDYSEAYDIERKIREIRLPFRAAVRTAYGKVGDLLKKGWKQDLVLAALETDDELMSRCKGIPIECLMHEAAEEIKGECDARLARVLPDFKKVFDAAFDDAAAEWLKKDARIRSYNSFWGKILQFFSPTYRRKVGVAWDRWNERLNGSPNYLRTRRITREWDCLRSSLIDSVLRDNADLRSRCCGVEKEKLPLLLRMSARGLLDRRYDEPLSYAAAYTVEIEQNGNMTHIDDDDAVDITEMEGVALRRRLRDALEYQLRGVKSLQQGRELKDNLFSDIVPFDTSPRMKDLRGEERRIGGFRIIAEVQEDTESNCHIYKAVCEESRYDFVDVGAEVALMVVPVQGVGQMELHEHEKWVRKLVESVHDFDDRADAQDIVNKYHGCFFGQGESGNTIVIVHVFVSGKRFNGGNLVVPSGDGWKLQITGALERKEITLPIDRRILVGRSHSADVRVPNTDISGKHIEISATSNGLQVLVFSSRGATVNGMELVQGDVATVSDGSEILLGSSVKIVVKKVPITTSMESGEEVKANGN